MAAASAVMLETGRQLNDAVSYLEKVSGGNALPGFEAEPAKPTIFITPKQFNEWQVESLPISEEIDNKLITYVENYKTDLEGFSTLPEDVLKAGNVLYKRPTAKESEQHIEEQLAGFGKAQQSFKAGEIVKYGTKGSVRPDFCIGNTCAIEVKNYDLTKNQSALARTIGKQVIARSKNLPEGMTQEVWIDNRGQVITEPQKDIIKDKIVKKSNGLIKREDINFMKEGS